LPAPPDEIVSQIVELKNEFQSVADRHPWISLYIPPIEKEREGLFLGETAASPYSPNELTRTHPETGRNYTVRIALGVNSPRNMACQAVVDRVQRLTDRTERLLKYALEYDSQIPPDVKQAIREWEQRKMCYGWVRWLWYATVVRCDWRIENYPQIAANALGELNEALRHPTMEPSASRPSTGRRNVPKKAMKDKKVEARNKWIYQKCFRGIAHDIIKAELKKIGPKRGWQIVSTKQRIQQIGKEYAERNGEPLPPPRQNKK